MSSELHDPKYVIQLTLLCGLCGFKYDYIYMIPSRTKKCSSMGCPKCSSHRGIFIIGLECDISEEFDDPVYESE